jgi:hypothetical protein
MAKRLHIEVAALWTLAGLHGQNIKTGPEVGQQVPDFSAEDLSRVPECSRQLARSQFTFDSGAKFCLTFARRLRTMCFTPLTVGSLC